jgi:GH35 family endo-1,4-beta-xylanase
MIFMNGKYLDFILSIFRHMSDFNPEG